MRDEMRNRQSVKRERREREREVGEREKQCGKQIPAELLCVLMSSAYDLDNDYKYHIYYA